MQITKMASGWVLVAALGAASGVCAQEGTWDKVKTYAHTQKEAAVAEGKKVLEATDKKIEAMKKDTRNASAETKAAHAQNMKDLEEKKKAAQAELVKLEKASANAWDATKQGVATAYKDLHHAYEKATASSTK